MAFPVAGKINSPLSDTTSLANMARTVAAYNVDVGRVGPFSHRGYTLSNRVLHGSDPPRMEDV